MTEVTGELVKKLRDQTGAGMMDCKNALKEANGDMALAVEVLRKKGLKDIGKRSGKTAAEGVIGVYTHPGSQIVGVVELNCETDFVARGEAFRDAAKDLAMQVTAMRPTYVAVEDVPESVLTKEKEILFEQLDEKQKAKADVILPGRLEKFYSDNVLLRQPFVKDDSGKKTVKDVLDELGIKTGEKIVLRRFMRFEVGEGIEKQQSDFASEIAAMTGGK